MQAQRSMDRSADSDAGAEAHPSRAPHNPAEVTMQAQRAGSARAGELSGHGSTTANQRLVSCIWSCIWATCIDDTQQQPLMKSYSHIYLMSLHPSPTCISCSMCASTILVMLKLLSPPLATSFRPQLRRNTFTTSVNGARGGCWAT
jgi:hypothetical protein